MAAPIVLSALPAKPAAAPNSGAEPAPSPGGGCSRWAAPVIGLLLLSIAVQLIVIVRAAVPELDTVRFVEAAKQFDEQGLFAALRGRQDQPLFPLSVWLVHRLLLQAMGDFPAAWAIGAQLAAAIPLVLAIVPVYFLSVRLLGTAAGLAGAVLFGLLPKVAQLGADGIGDSSHLLWFSLAFWAVVVYLTEADDPSRRRPSRLFWAGLATGMALLARVEVLVLWATLLGLLMLAQVSPRHRMAWPALLAGAGCLVLGTGLLFGSYLAVVGVSRPRDVIDRALGRHSPPDQAPPARSASPPTTVRAVWRLEDGQPMSFTRRDPNLSLRRHTVVAALRKSVVDLANAFNMLIGLFALVGFWQVRRRPARPVDWLVRTFVIVYLLLAAGFAVREGYVSPRHFLVVIVAAIGCAGYGLVQSGVWLASSSILDFRSWILDSVWNPKPRTPGSRIQDPKSKTHLLCSWTLVALAAITCLPEDLRPLRASRLGHRQAGQWLARSAVPGSVLETWGLSGFYSGRKTWRFNEAQSLFSNPDLAYVVLQERELTFATARSRTLRRLLELAAEPAARFADPCPVGGGVGESVVVYRWHPERLSRAIALLLTPPPS
jgi:uncharacterized membrane protein